MPMYASSTLDGSTRACANAPLTAAAPRSVAGTADSAPWNEPTGVRAAPTMKTLGNCGPAEPALVEACTIPSQV